MRRAVAKKRATTAAEPESIRVKYDLHDLPTAQHKAGLAGLLLQAESMRERGLPADSIPQVDVTGGATAEAVFTEQSIRGLFDDLYDARIVETRSATKWSGKPPKREETVAETVSPADGAELVEPGVEDGASLATKGKSKPKRWFIYDVVQPQGHFLRRFTDDGKEIWHKLWHDMLWAIPRGKPTTRGPFNDRAEGKSTGEGEAVWRELLLMDNAARSGEVRTCEVAGAIWLGAQAVSAEVVPFRDRIEHALLLHFWQLTVSVLLHGSVQITTQAIGLCVHREIGVHWLGAGGRHVASLTSSPG